MNLLRSPRRTPEEEELSKKEAEVQKLREELADGELRLKSFQLEIEAFGARYNTTVGLLYAEIDELNAKIAETTAERAGTNEARRDAAEARSQARDSYEKVHRREPTVEREPPTAELKSLYRDAAKRLHPDLASHEADRKVRSELMAEANRAYELGDAERLRAIVEAYDASPESISGSDVGSRLIRAIREIAVITERLAEISKALDELNRSDLAILKAKVDQATEDGYDLLDTIAKGLSVEIAHLRSEFDLLIREGHAT